MCKIKGLHNNLPASIDGSPLSKYSGATRLANWVNNDVKGN